MRIKRDQAQLVYDLLIEKGFYDNLFENRFFFLMNYNSDVNNEVSENNILDFHLSHKVISNFEYQPKKNTPKFIWKYLSNANLLQNTELIDLENYDEISLLNKQLMKVITMRMNYLSYTKDFNLISTNF